jgi:hypothetical protein
MSTEFSMDRDVYTSAELAAVYYDIKIENVELWHIRTAVPALARLGMLRAIRNRRQVVWPNGAGRHVLYSVRNHRRYMDDIELMAHLRPHPEPVMWNRFAGPKIKAPKIKNSPLIVEEAVERLTPTFPEDRDLYTSSEVASAVLGRPATTLADKRLGTTYAVKHGWAKMVNGGKMVRWPGAGVNPLFLYSVRNHERYSSAEGVRKHLLGTEYPVLGVVTPVGNITG